MSTITKKLPKLSSGMLAPSEEIKRDLRVNLKGTALGVGVAALGGVVPALVAGKIMKAGQEEAKESGIPFSQQMALGLTDKRILVWKRSVFGGAPKDLLGEIPFSDIQQVDFGKGGLGDKLVFTLKDGKPLELESVKVDKGGGFASLLSGALES